MSVIDTATKTVVATIEDPSFDEPVAVAVKPDGSEAWVVNNFSGTVSIIDTATNLVTGTVDDGNGCFNNPTGIVFNPVLPEAYVVADPDGTALCIVDTSSNTVVDTVFFSAANAVLPVVTPDGAKVYVTGDDVTIIDTATRNDRSITPFDLSTVTYLAVSNDGTKVYAAGNDSFLEIIDSSSADFTNDDFTDSFVDFGSAFSINTVAVVPGTDVGVVTDLNEGSLLWAFDTSTDTEIAIRCLSRNPGSSPVAIIAIGGGSTTAPPPPWTFRTAGWAPAGSARAGWSSAATEKDRCPPGKAPG